jgi:hypothetical protein
LSKISLAAVNTDADRPMLAACSSICSRIGCSVLIGPGAGDQARSAISGPRWRQMAELAMDSSRVFWTSCRSRPLRRARAIASAAATVCTASSRLAMYFIRAPVPNAPV